MEVIIELPGRGSQGNELQKFSGEQIRIGRALDNDLILTDPHVCAHHAVLETGENGEIILRDLDSVNGSIVDKQSCDTEACTVESGAECLLGKTRLRVYRPDHAVPPSIQLTWVEKLAQLANKPVLAGGLCLLLMCFTVYTQYAKELSTFHIGREILTAVGVLMVFALWPTGWSLFARYKKHETRFLAQLSATIVFIIILSILEKLDGWLAFHNGANLIVNGIILVITVILALLLIWFHYYLSIFLGNKKRWAYSAALTALFGSIIYIGSTIDNDSFNSRPEYTARLYPPSVSFYTTQSSGEFLDKAGKLFSSATDQAGFETE